MSLTAIDSRSRVASSGYVVIVMVLTALAMIEPNHPRKRLLIVALVLCLPAVLAALPLLYVTLATAWNVTNADSGGVTWPVTAAYVAVVGLIAVGNLWLVSRIRSRT